MKKGILLIFAACLLVANAMQAAAQSPAPPKVLAIFREEVKAGRGAAHAKLEAGYVHALRKAKWPVYGLAMTTVSGPNDAWFMTGYESFEAMEQDHRNTEKNAALMSEFDRLDEADTQFRTNQRMMIAVFREDLSHQPNINVAQMRYFNVLTFRIRPGHEAEFNEAAKIVRSAYEKTKADVHWATYQIATGAPGGTYLVFIPMKSLKAMDPNPEIGKAFQEALGSDNQKRLDKIASDAYLSEESTVWAFSPRMSYVPKEWVAADPEFWTVKEPKPVAKKPAAKPAAKPAVNADGNKQP